MDTTQCPAASAPGMAGMAWQVLTERPTIVVTSIHRLVSTAGSDVSTVSAAPKARTLWPGTLDGALSGVASRGDTQSSTPALLIGLGIATPAFSLPAETDGPPQS